MAIPVTDVVKVNWKQVFPWLVLFRTFGLALHARQILVGAIAAGLIAFGHWIVLGSDALRIGPSITMLPENALVWPGAPWIDVIWPLLPFSSDFGTVSWWRYARVVVALTWGLAVGGLAGGILVRRAAFEFAREESLSLTEAIRFVWKRGFDYLSAPALPLSIVLVIGLLLTLGGWMATALPGGPYLVSAIWGLIFLGGFVMAVMLTAVLVGWPMMVSAVSINGGDGFDALSRGFGFVIDRWRYYAWCLGVMTAYGSIGYLLCFAAIQGADYLIQSSFALGAGQSASPQLPQLPLPGFWSICLNLATTGLAYSYFWSSMTVIYLVLRKSVDNAELDAIFVDGGPHGADDLQALLNPTVAAPPTLLPIIDSPTHS